MTCSSFTSKCKIAIRFFVHRAFLVRVSCKPDFRRMSVESKKILCNFASQSVAYYSVISLELILLLFVQFLSRFLLLLSLHSIKNYICVYEVIPVRLCTWQQKHREKMFLSSSEWMKLRIREELEMRNVMSSAVILLHLHNNYTSFLISLQWIRTQLNVFHVFRLQ